MATGFVFAQENAGNDNLSTIQFGATLKVHQSNIRGIHDYSKARIAPAIGVFAQIPLNSRVENNIYFVPQLEFSMEGENAKEPKGDQKFHFSYINVPLYLKYYFGFNKENTNKNLFVMAGPKFGFAVSEKREGAVYNPQDIAAEGHHKKFNLAASVGGGYRFTENFEGYLRYDHGFTKAYDNYTLQKTYNYQLGAGINYIFGTNK